MKEQSLKPPHKDLKKDKGHHAGPVVFVVYSAWISTRHLKRLIRGETAAPDDAIALVFV